MRPRRVLRRRGSPKKRIMEAIEQAAATAEQTGETVSTIGSEMTIAGQISCAAGARIFGRVEGRFHGTSVVIGAGAHVQGELAGADFMIDEGAEVEGQIRAQKVMVHGRVKGTIRAAEVKLLGCARVEGDIFHQRLSMAEATQFEGSSRLLQNGE